MLHVTGTKEVFIGDRIVKINGVATTTKDVIESATEAEPAEITMTGHPFSNGDLVIITGAVDDDEPLPKWNTADGDWYHVTKEDNDTISLQEKDGTTDVDSTGWGAGIDGGTVTKIEDDLWDVTGEDTTVRRVDFSDDWNDGDEGLAAIDPEDVVEGDLLYTPVTKDGDTIGTAPEWGILVEDFVDNFMTTY
jgi:hypothetical protein